MNVLEVIEKIKKKQADLVKTRSENPSEFVLQIVRSISSSEGWISAALIAAESLGEGKGEMPLPAAREMLIVAAPHVERAAERYPDPARAIARAMMRAGFIMPALAILARIGPREEDFPGLQHGLTPGLAVVLGARARTLARFGKTREVVKIALVLTRAIKGKQEVTSEEIAQALKGLGWFEGNQGNRFIRAGWITTIRVEEEMLFIPKNLEPRDLISRPRRRPNRQRPKAKLASANATAGAKPAGLTAGNDKGGR